MKTGLQVSQLLKSLIPTNQEELSALRYILYCAQLIQRGAPLNGSYLGEHAQRTEQHQGALALNDFKTLGLGLDLPAFLASLSDEAQRYFHGLVEAVEIHQSIHGQALAIQNLTLSDKAVYELKQIRDMCLEDGLRSIY